MACCKCCCEGKSTPGVCCGIPGSCCEAPRVCCSASDEPESASATCCPEGQICCEGSCADDCYGACCSSSNVCGQDTREGCEASGGTFLGVGVPCSPDPCGCDPPCTGCSECVAGNCESTCQPDEFCCDGTCQAEPCEPPCEPPCDGCSDCVEGDCISSCSEGQYCCDGVCQDDPCVNCNSCQDYISSGDPACADTVITGGGSTCVPQESITPCNMCVGSPWHFAIMCASPYLQSIGVPPLIDGQADCFCIYSTSSCSTEAINCQYDEFGNLTCAKLVAFTQIRQFVYTWNPDTCEWSLYLEGPPIDIPSACYGFGDCACPDVPSCTAPGCGATYSGCPEYCPAAASVKAVEAGPGTELKKLLSKVGIKATPNCSCNAKAKAMDKRGVEWCEQNVETICDWLQEEATKRKLPFLRAAGKALIYMAIRRAKKNTSK